MKIIKIMKLNYNDKYIKTNENDEKYWMYKIMKYVEYIKNKWKIIKIY